MTLEKEIAQLIKLKHEGSYWDFKKQWYKDDNESYADMLHDIICFANNQVNRDCYIIIGVTNKMEIVGVSSDSFRRNTQQMTDFLKNKKFAGDFRPSVHVESVVIEGKEIDIIVIENSQNTPFYLREQFRGVNPNNIYTRIQDTNTPKTATADIDKVEYLWKKRFGLVQTIKERFVVALEDYKNWFQDLGNKTYMYSKIYPEYHMDIEQKCELDCEAIKCFYTNEKAYLYEVKCFYNNTIIYETNIWAVDEYRKFIVKPMIKSLNKESTKRCYCYDLSTIEGKINRILCPNFQLKSRECLDIPILYFTDEDNFKEFYDYVQITNYDKKLYDEYKYYILKDSEYSRGRYGISAEEVVESYVLYKMWKSLNK